MIKKALIFAVTAASLATGASAFAQTYDHRGDGNGRYERHDRDGRNDRADRNDRDGRGDRNDRYDRDTREHRSDYNRRDSRDGYVYYGDGRYGRTPQYNSYSNNNGYYDRGNAQRWRTGMYLGDQYRSNRYVVSDWRHHNRLYAPQRGYQWVQQGNDYLLVAIATGIIAQVLLGN